jgi:hypothetical protein
MNWKSLGNKGETATRGSWRRTDIDIRQAKKLARALVGNGEVIGGPTLLVRAAPLPKDNFKNKAVSLCWCRAHVTETSCKLLAIRQILRLTHLGS